MRLYHVAQIYRRSKSRLSYRQLSKNCLRRELRLQTDKEQSPIIQANIG